MRRRTPVLIAAAGVAVLAAAAVVAVVVTRSGGHESTDTHSIPGADGVRLSAYVIPPKGAGPHPLLVMPASWGSGADEYLAVGRRLAEHGYDVVSYAQRGFEGSGGKIDIAGSQTQADVSAVITWALAHTHAAPGGVGAVGVSYGAGISLLAAERDPRIKVVVAMSGWADLAASFEPNSTASLQAITTLMASARSSGNPGAEVRAVIQASTSRDAGALSATSAAISPSRSPATGIAALDRNRTAVMLAQAFEDSIFPPSQQVALFDELSGPKRLQLARGDHGGPEHPGLLGAESDSRDGGDDVWHDATAWLDHYLRAKDNGIDREDAVQVQDVRTGQWHHYPDVAAAGRSTRLYLGRPGAGVSLAPHHVGDWTDPITAGTDTIADAGVAQYGPEPYRLPPAIPMTGVSRSHAAVWDGGPVPRAALVSGAPALHVTLTPSAPNATLYAYLYDVDASGSGTLMTFKPYSVLGATPGKPRALDIALEPISWTVAAGHHLSLVVDTVDPRYLSVSAPGSTVAFSSSTADPSTLSVPIG